MFQERFSLYECYGNISYFCKHYGNVIYGQEFIIFLNKNVPTKKFPEQCINNVNVLKIIIKDQIALNKSSIKMTGTAERTLAERFLT